MLRLKPYRKEYADTIISWSQDERAFYKWSAGVMGAYPITKKEFGFVDSIMTFSAFDEEKMIGFFTLRNPGGKIDELRIGFVILDPRQRGCGKGKEMIRLALNYAFEVYGARRVSLGVFENNESAYYCYKAAGFKEVILDETETYIVHNEEWRCKEMIIER
ncbi:MAG: GNAT family N-acetyltransferase [Butyrivibrio sp.]|nr:GNAT family protein [Butyrivibrio sp.]MBE5839353.1 GNAT family N-acetyltransferase [Butyrivibrio sp.]